MDPVIAHAGHSAPPDLPVRVAVNALAGLLAAIVANVPAHRQREGSTPAFVLAGALTGRAPVDVSAAAASATHYVLGTLGGAVFALVVAALEGVLPALPTVPGTPLSLAAHVAAGVVVLLLLFVAVGYVVVPAATDWSAERTATVRAQWATTATVYAAALVVAVPLLTTALV